MRTCTFAALLGTETNTTRVTERSGLCPTLVIDQSERIAMPTHGHDALDNPIWNALTTYQAGLASGNERAKRYPPLVTPLAGMADQDAGAFDSLAAILGAQPMVGLFLDRPAEPPPNWDVLQAHPIRQMIWAGSSVQAASEEITPMTAA